MENVGRVTFSRSVNQRGSSKVAMAVEIGPPSARRRNRAPADFPFLIWATTYLTNHLPGELIGAARQAGCFSANGIVPMHNLRANLLPAEGDHGIHIGMATPAFDDRVFGTTKKCQIDACWGDFLKAVRSATFTAPDVDLVGR